MIGWAALVVTLERFKKCPVVIAFAVPIAAIVRRAR